MPPKQHVALPQRTKAALRHGKARQRQPARRPEAPEHTGGSAMVVRDTKGKEMLTRLDGEVGRAKVADALAYHFKAHLVPNPPPPAQLKVTEDGSIHKVQHIALLNRDSFWWLMGSLCFFVAGVVVTIEVNEKRRSSGKTLEPSGSGLLSLTKKSSSSNLHGEAAQDPPEVRAEESRDEKGTDAEGKRDGNAISTCLQLTLCVVGLNVSMLLWGIAQEFIMTNEYGDPDVGRVEKLNCPLFLVLCNRLGSVLFSGLLVRMHGEPLRVDCWPRASIPAITNLMASWCQYSSIAYISFPLQTIAKCAKLLPVLMLSSLRGKRQTFLDYAEALVITSAVVIFGLETDGLGGGFEMHHKGIIFLGGMMIFDSVTPHMQDALFQAFPKLLVIQATLAMAAFASVVSATVLICNGQLISSIMFLHEFPEAALHIMVLSLCSTVTQFLITYTIKNFGPVAFIIIVTTRQMVSVCLSSVLFMHHISVLAGVAAMIVFGAVIMRALWKTPGAVDAATASATPATPLESAAALNLLVPTSLRGTEMSDTRRLIICAVAMHMPLCLWAVAQEFIATHTFSGQLFPSSLFIISVNRLTAVIFAFFMLRARGLPVAPPEIIMTALPGSANFLSTIMQYQALYFVRFPQQTLMKTVKVIPVMMCGWFLKNRVYHVVDYLEAALLSSLAGVFVWYFEQGKESLHESHGSWVGIVLMCGYLVADSFTSNLEDYVFQKSKLDPGQMLLGSELGSGMVSWIILLGSGQLLPSLRFVWEHETTMLHICILALASTCGAYACTVTIRLYGPAVFTLLMMSRQIFSLVISVLLFQHKVDMVSIVCLIVVALLILTSSLRRVSVMRPHAKA